VGADRADVAVRAWSVQLLSLAVVRETQGVGSNLQPERAKRKNVPARAQCVGAEMHCVGGHVRRVGVPRTACGLVRAVDVGLGDSACVPVRRLCASPGRTVVGFSHRVRERGLIVCRHTRDVAIGMRLGVAPNDRRVASPAAGA
jgi:hypothetical protein